MKIILWLRAVKKLNFYNWNNHYKDHLEVVIVNLKELKNIELGMIPQITSVNRTTGKITLDIE